MVAYSSVLSLRANSAGTCPVGAALLRGHILNVLAQGFAIVAQASTDGRGGTSGAGTSAGGSSGSAGGSSGASAGMSGGNGAELKIHFKANSAFLGILPSIAGLGNTVGSELAAALAESGVLEHAAAALLRLAERLHRSFPTGGDGSGGRGGDGDEGGNSTAAAVVAAELKSLWGAHQLAAEQLLLLLLLLLDSRRCAWDQLTASTDRRTTFGPANTAEEGLTAAMAEEARSFVCGPALQLFLLACVANAGADVHLVEAVGELQPRQEHSTQVRAQQPLRLPGALALRWQAHSLNRQYWVAATGTELATLGAALDVAALVLQATVMGCGGVLPFAQPPHGYPQQLAAAAAAAAASEPRPRPRPQHLSPFTRSPVCVYDLVARTCESVLAATAAAAAGSSSSSGASSSSNGCQAEDTYKLLWLLVRLLPELPPRQAAARLPGLWRLLVAALPNLLDSHQVEKLTIDAAGLMNDASLLLRLRVDADGRVPPLPDLQQALARPQQQQQQQQQQAQPSADEAGPAAAADDAAAAAPASEPRCSYSLRCALDAGLLPALEQLLRKTFAAAAAAQVGTAAAAAPAAGSSGAGPAAGAQQQQQQQQQQQSVTADRVMVALHGAGSLLLASGVFPAVLIHGAAREVVPLLATLCCVQRQLAVSDVKLQTYARLGSAAVLWPKEVRLPASAAGYWKLVLGCLLEQTESVLVLAADAGVGPGEAALWTSAGSPQSSSGAATTTTTTSPQAAGTGASCVNGSGGACGGGVSSHGANAAAPAPASDAADVGGINRWLLPLRVDRAWLAAAAGGLPAPGSAAYQCLHDFHLLLILSALPAMCDIRPDYLLATPLVYLDVALIAARGATYTHRRLLQSLLAHGVAASLERQDRDRRNSGSSSGATAGSGDGGAGRGAWPSSSYTPKEHLLLLQAHALGWVHAYMTMNQLTPISDIVLHLQNVDTYADAGRQLASTGLGSLLGEEPAAGTPAGAAAAPLTAAAAGANGARAVGTGSGGGVELPLVVADLLKPLTDDQRRIAARDLLDLLELDAVTSACVELGMLATRCPDEALPFLMMPPRALHFLNAWGLRERPWLQPFLLPGPDEGRWERLRPKAARPQPRPVTAVELAAGKAAFKELYTTCMHRYHAEDWNWRCGAPQPTWHACQLLRAEAEAEAEQQGRAADTAAQPGTSGAGGSTGGHGASAGGSEGRAAVPAVCAYPACRNLDGPSALIVPGSGKTCVRCRAVTYCCGACQLQDWREGGHCEVCPCLVEARKLVQGRGAVFPCNGDQDWLVC
ncbi:hypothetical protein HYH02_010397 [Chlamydomonas schloesseri]|uniref:phytol kinase n=1 Tax=Chlamydomonas schloesseri TaxID=2026947 RepID=A0A835W7W0_9CHLO|nr:hypothetical protein HYH02_010397 [Chlamydomonas schloesseri]|eukprot:KAG2440519.1 hypothetical protein HYH02_010397 [Chlamydomonas schloesseri]